DLLRRAADQLVVALEGVAPAPEEGEAAAVAARGAAHQGERLQKLFALKAQAARRLLVLLLDLVQELGEGDGRVLARELGKDLDEPLLVELVEDVVDLGRGHLAEAAHV